MTPDGLITGADLLQAMPDRITDGPQYEPEDNELLSGVELFRDLPNTFANDLIVDEIFESAGNGKTYLETLVDFALQRDGVAMVKTMLRCIEQAGDSQVAIDKWEEITHDA